MKTQNTVMCFTFDIVEYRLEQIFLRSQLNVRITVSCFKISCQNNGNEARLDKSRQDKTRQDKTRQDKTRQDKTRQDTYGTVQYLQSFIILFSQTALVLYQKVTRFFVPVVRCEVKCVPSL
jgi:hypothetical protein